MLRDDDLLYNRSIHKVVVDLLMKMYNPKVSYTLLAIELSL